MKNRDSYQADQNGDKAGDRVESLLHAAAAFVPEQDAPNDIVATALGRLGGEVKTARRSVFTFAVSGALMGACALAAAAFILTHPARTPTHAIVARTTNAETPRKPGVEARVTKPVLAVANREMLIPTQIRAASVAFHVSHERRRQRIARREIAVTRPEARRILPMKALTLPPRQAIATNTPPPLTQSGWTTEDVQETNYMLVSPGVLTEGSGASEKATPVMVSIPINASESGAVDSYKADVPEPDIHCFTKKESNSSQ